MEESWTRVSLLLSLLPAGWVMLIDAGREEIVTGNATVPQHMAEVATMVVDMVGAMTMMIAVVVTVAEMIVTMIIVAETAVLAETGGVIAVAGGAGRGRAAREDTVTVVAALLPVTGSTVMTIVTVTVVAVALTGIIVTVAVAAARIGTTAEIAIAVIAPN